MIRANLFSLLLLALPGGAFCGSASAIDPVGENHTTACIANVDFMAAVAVLGQRASTPPERQILYPQRAKSLAYTLRMEDDLEFSQRAGLVARPWLLFRLDRSRTTETTGDHAEMYVTLAQFSGGVFGDRSAAPKRFGPALKLVPNHALALGTLPPFKAHDDRLLRLQGMTA